MSIYSMRTKFAKGLKFTLVAIIIVFVLGAFWQFGAPGGPSNRAKEDKSTVAIVNGTEIPMSAFNAKWQAAQERADQQSTRSLLTYADIKTSVIVNLIQETQLQQVAKDMGIDVSQKAVDNETDKMVAEALKANRKSIMGSVTKEQDAIDPRKDKEYAKTLSQIQRTVKMQEDEIRSRIPEAEIRAEIAQQGIMAQIKEQVSKISEQDIKDSYRTYTIKQILLPKGKVSDAQLLQQAQNIIKEARANKDFNKLAAANSALPDKASGSQIDYSLESSFVVPPEVGKVVENMKPGMTSDPILSDIGYYVVQLVSVKENIPAKLDKKRMEERKKLISQVRESAAIREIARKLESKDQIQIKDPELDFLYSVYNANRQATSLEDMMKRLKDASSKFAKAFNLTGETASEAENSDSRSASDIALAKFGQVQAVTGDTDGAIKTLSAISNNTPSADISKMIGDLLVKKDRKADAIKYYQDASDMARFDIDLRKSLVESYNQIGRKDLAAAETALIAKKEADIKLWEKKNPGDAPPLPGQNPHEGHDHDIPATP